MVKFFNSRKNNELALEFLEINQLYHPVGIFHEESQEIVYSLDDLNSTKFVPILLKEWFFLLKIEGYLVIDYRPNKICDWQKLEENMWWLWKNKYEIIYHGPIHEKKINPSVREDIVGFINHQEKYFKNDLNSKTLLPKKIATKTQPDSVEGYLRFVCKKTSSGKIKTDTIESWTFGIITSGGREAWLENIIKSIRQQAIPNFEIIVCGTYFDRKEPNFRYIPFNRRDDKGWITKKKNIIAREAKFQNLCIMHDRIFLDKNWFSGIKKWGNCFEVMAVPQFFEGTKERFGDWVCNKGFSKETANDFIPLRGGYLEYKDWDIDVPTYAAITIIKKYIFEKNGFNETLYWNEYDDLLLHKSISSKGYILRMNPDAIVFSKTKSVFDLKWKHTFDPLKLGKLKNVSFFQKATAYLFHCFNIKKKNKALNWVKLFLKRRQQIKTHRDTDNVL